jgi:hypothetical protein
MSDTYMGPIPIENIHPELVDALAEFEDLKRKYRTVLVTLSEKIERKDVALRVALDALALANGFILEDGDLDHAIETVQEALG